MNSSITRLFFKYLIPAITGTLSVGILIFIDTIFIGRGIGAMGLAALNTALPVFTIYSSIGLLLGMGGATAAAVDSGRGDSLSKNTIFTISIYFAIGISIILSVWQFLSLDSFVLLLGATPELFEYVKSYVSTLLIFTSFYLLPHTLSTFIRNDNNPNLSMIGMVFLGIINIVLDYLFIFIFDFGMMGAALATGIAQLVYFLILLTHFFTNKNSLKIMKNINLLKPLKRIIKNGLPSFFNDISMGVSIFAFNLVLFNVSGDIGVSSYSILLNINFLVYLVFVGIAQASQPILSLNYGAGNSENVTTTLKLGTITATIFSLFTFIVLTVFSKETVNLFIKEDPILLDITSRAIPIFFTSVILMGINIILAAYYQSTERSTFSSILTLLRGLVLLLLGLFILPNLFGINGVWLTPLFAEVITFIVAVYVYLKK